jgi:lipoyl-dependent peroxiredoxin
MTTYVERIAARRATRGIMIRRAHGPTKGSSPEALLAAAHAECYARTLAFSLQAAGYVPTELSTEATVTREPDGPGYRISCSALILRAKVPNLSRETFETMAWHAVNNCPISKVLRAQIRLDAKLL